MAAIMFWALLASLAASAVFEANSLTDLTPDLANALACMYLEPPIAQA